MLKKICQLTGSRSLAGFAGDILWLNNAHTLPSGDRLHCDSNHNGREIYSQRPRECATEAVVERNRMKGRKRPLLAHSGATGNIARAARCGAIITPE
jgi:hypothetical protein